MRIRSAVVVFIVAVTALADACRAHAAEATSSARSFSDMSLEELMNIEVTSGARKPQRVADTASAVYVITAEDIRRSGVTSIPEALRMAPGVEVARFGSNKWAVSIRGFNGRFANKLLVLMDGRTIYTPLFSGVLWEMHDTVLEDIERIEVIRGPGAALWGANAVNGVINIITRKSGDTQGTLVSAGAGTSERAFGTVRYGGTLGGDGAYRVYAKAFARDRFQDLSGREGHDDWNNGVLGFRLDRTLAAGEELLVQGNAFNNKVGEQLTSTMLVPPYQLAQDVEQHGKGANLQLRWQGKSDAGSGTALQGYFDYIQFNLGGLVQSRQTLDMDYQRQMRLGRNQDLVMGAGYRLSRDTITPTDAIGFSQTSLDSRLYSAFVQDDITLVRERLRLTIGSRFEHNSYTGREIQPNARLLWTPAPEHSVWGAVSRAVRTPARFEDYGRIRQAVVPPFAPGNPSPFPVEAVLTGSTTFNAERMLAYELGYRAQLSALASLDWTVFSNRYEGIRGFIQGAPQLVFTPAPARVLTPLDIANNTSGRINGTELAIEVRPSAWWRLQGHAGLQWLSFNNNTGSDNMLTGSAPRHTFSLRSTMNLDNNVELDLWLRHVDSLSFLAVPAYNTLDARLGWKPRRNLEVSVAGQNLLQPQHQEYVSDFIGTATNQVPRSAYVKLDWRF